MAHHLNSNVQSKVGEMSLVLCGIRFLCQAKATLQKREWPPLVVAASMLEKPRGRAS